jgi:dTDP-4-amino-4,6-dideoxygalactose transaminase
MAAGVDGRWVRARRRRNYHILVEDLRPWLAPGAPKRLPDGVSPLSLPLLLDDRDGALAALSERGIEAFVFGKLPHPAMDAGRFPATASLRRHLLGIPVHQQLDDVDLARIRAAVRAVVHLRE